MVCVSLSDTGNKPFIVAGQTSGLLVVRREQLAGGQKRSACWWSEESSLLVVRREQLAGGQKRAACWWSEARRTACLWSENGLLKVRREQLAGGQKKAAC